MNTTSAEFNKTVLSNGIRIISERVPSVRSISIGAWLNAGSRDEIGSNNGISHFIEHMVFKGTKNRSALEIAESLESVGGHLNAFTGKELTCYYAHILDEHLPLAVSVLADIMSNAVFDPEEMEKEKRVILEELNALEETPEELIHEIFLENLFPEHPLGFSVIGKRDNIIKFNRENIVAYLSKNYTAERLVVAAAGNVNHAHFVELIEKHFQALEKRGQRSYVSPNVLHPGKSVIDNGAIQAHICLGTHAYSYKNEKKFSLLVLNTLLGSGMSSRLFQNIREKHGLAYSVYSFIDFMFDTGLFGVYIGTDREKIDHSIELIIKEFDTLRKKVISDSEMERIKAQLKGNLILGLESTSSRMNRLAKMEIYLQKYFTLNDTLDEIANVTADDLMNVANELFETNRIQISVLRPRSQDA